MSQAKEPSSLRKLFNAAGVQAAKLNNIAPTVQNTAALAAYHYGQMAMRLFS